MTTSFEPQTVWYSFQTHRFLLHICTQYFLVALTHDLHVPIKVTRALIFLCARGQIGSSVSSPQKDSLEYFFFPRWGLC